MHKSSVDSQGTENFFLEDHINVSYTVVNIMIKSLSFDSHLCHFEPWYTYIHLYLSIHLSIYLYMTQVGLIIFYKIIENIGKNVEEVFNKLHGK
jgi:hypothetical protein